MTPAETLDAAALRSWIGRQDVAHDVLTEDLARKFAVTLGTPVARAGEPAPPLIHFCLAQPAMPPDALGPDGHPRRGGFLPPVPLPRRMWAGGEVAFHRDLRVGETIVRRSRIADVTVKEGRTGRLCFVAVAHAIEVDGATAIDEVQTLVYRDAAPVTPPGKPPPQAAEGEHVDRVVATPTLLFRYSAITFNGHRIHYDRPYATGEEGYPGLVVHGPLQATWLCHLAAKVRGRTPARFTYRGLSPVCDGHTIGVHAREGEDGRLSLWTAQDRGPVAMAAEAFW
jgi:3-methylfumaryl-CoA hydratase